MLRVLGELELEYSGQRLALPPSRKARALLAYLAVTGRRHSRDHLCDVFWDQSEDPRGALRWGLSRLRAAGQAGAVLLLVSDRDGVGIASGTLQLDLAALREAVEQGLSSQPATRLESLAAICRGPFLEGLDLPDCPRFSAWRTAEQEQARTLHGRVLRALCERLPTGTDRALMHARAWADMDAQDPHAHAALVTHLLAAGRSEDAGRCFEAARQRLEGTGARRMQPLLDAWNGGRGAAPGRTDTGVPPASPVEPLPKTGGTVRKPVTVVVLALPPAFPLGPDMIAARAGLHHGRCVRSGHGELMLVFGAPTALEDHAVLAVCFVLSLPAREGAGAARAGIASGPALVRLGSALDVLGPVPERASRLCGTLASGGIVVDAETARLAHGYVETAMPMAMDGIPAAEAIRVIRNRPVPHRWAARLQQDLSPWTDRKGELAMLNAALDIAAEARGQVLLVTGEPGIGKSRLLHEFLCVGRARDWRQLVAGAHPLEEATGQTLADALVRTWLALDPGAAGTAARERLRDALVELGADAAALWPALAAMLERRDTATAQRQGDARAGTPEFIDALCGLLLLLARQRPTVVVVDDAQWLDTASQALLGRLAVLVHAAPLLLVVSCRSTAHFPWNAGGDVLRLALGPLPPPACRTLLDALLGHVPETDRLEAALARHCGGNPLFMEETVRALERVEPDGPLPLPLAVQGLLAARIDALPINARPLLEAAAVAADPLPLSLLAEVVTLQGGGPDQALAVLVAAGLLREVEPTAGGRACAFPHPMVRELVYGTIPPAHRQSLHRQVAMVLERIGASPEPVDALAAHLEAGQSWESAIHYLLRAAQGARERDDLAGAVARARHAADLAARHGTFAVRRVQALLQLGDLLGLQEDLPGANEAYRQALALEPDRRTRTRIELRLHRWHGAGEGEAPMPWCEHGTGPGTVLVLHPLPCGPAALQSLLEALGERVRVVVIGGPGSHEAPPEEAAEGVRAVLDAAVPDGTVAVIAFAHAADLALRLAADDSGRWSRLVLVDAAHPVQAQGLLPTLGVPALVARIGAGPRDSTAERAEHADADVRVRFEDFPGPGTLPARFLARLSEFLAVPEPG